MNNTQQKINMAIAAINYLTNTLDQVNIQMALIPSTAFHAQTFQDARVKQHEEIGAKIIELANEIGDCLSELDALGEEELGFINPIFDFLNKEEQ